jgi:hypothetical protein
LHGFESQLPAYEASESSEESIYVILRVGESTTSINDVMALRDKQISAGKKVPDVVVIDARRVESASRRGKPKRRKPIDKR